MKIIVILIALFATNFAAANSPVAGDSVSPLISASLEDFTNTNHQDLVGANQGSVSIDQNAAVVNGVVSDLGVIRLQLSAKRECGNLGLACIAEITLLMDSLFAIEKVEEIDGVVVYTAVSTNTENQTVSVLEVSDFSNALKEVKLVNETRVSLFTKDGNDSESPETASFFRGKTLRSFQAGNIPTAPVVPFGNMSQ